MTRRRAGLVTAMRDMGRVGSVAVTKKLNVARYRDSLTPTPFRAPGSIGGIAKARKHPPLDSERIYGG